MIELIIIAVVTFVSIAFVIYIIFWAWRKQSKINTTLKEINHIIKDHEQEKKSASIKAMEELIGERDREKIMKRAFTISSRFTREKGLEALDYLEKKLGDDITPQERKKIMYYRSQTLYLCVRFGDNDLSKLDEARRLGLELIRDKEYCSDPHTKLDVQEILRHIAMERKIKRGMGNE